MASVKYTDNKSSGREISIPCVKCSGVPAHKVLHSVDEDWEDHYYGGSYEWNICHEIVQCQGCKSISFRKTSMNSEDLEPSDDGEYMQVVVQEKLFPSRLAGRKGLGNDIHYLPSEVREIYEETLSALSSQSPILTGIGLRALLEKVCKVKHATGRNLSEQIDSLKNTSVLTPASAAILHKIRTLGNTAAHEAKPHTERQLGLAMDIIEHLLKETFILPKQVDAEFD